MANAGRLGSLSLDRRSMLGAGAAVIGGVALAKVAPTAAILQPNGPVRYVITDRNFTQSRQFGAAMTAYGAEALEVNEGLTALWAGKLVPHWRNPHGAVAGLTTRPVWDGLSQQAMGQFRKTRLIGVHRFDPSGGQMQHDVGVPIELLSTLDGNTLQQPNWGSGIARIVGACSQQERRRIQTCRFGEALAPLGSNHQLVSWMIV